MIIKITILKLKKIYTIKNMIGAIFLANRKKFLEIKMFDENFFFYWEDVDFSKRVQKSNYEIYINHYSKAMHSWTSTKFNLQSFFIKEINFKYGELYFQYKTNQLKYIKILRQPLTLFLKFIIYLISFNLEKAIGNILKIYAIIKFLILFLIIKKFTKNWSKFT